MEGQFARQTSYRFLLCSTTISSSILGRNSTKSFRFIAMHGSRQHLTRLLLQTGEVTSNQECARKAHTSDHSALSQMWRVTPWCSTNGRFCTASKPIPEVVDFKQSVGCQLEHRFWNGPLAGSQHSRSGPGKQLGRPRRIIDRDRVVRMKAEGLSLRDIASKLGAGYGTVRMRLAQMS